MNAAHRIAVSVVGGFLGAGKTTLLNQWLRLPSCKRVAILVNDFGALNIDAELIGARRGDTIALSNGCICCKVGGDLTKALIQLLENAPSYDELWIETSGVSDPGRVAKLVKAVPELELRCVIVLVDTVMIESQLKDSLLHEQLMAQIKSADCLLLTKTRLTEPASAQSVMHVMQSINPNAICLEDDESGINVAQIKDTGICAANINPWTCNPGHQSRFSSWIGYPKLLLPACEWRQRLQALPQEVLRVKGFVQTLDQGWLIVQRAGQLLEFKQSEASTHTPAALVAIGVRGSLPQEALDGLLNA